MVEAFTKRLRENPKLVENRGFLTQAYWRRAIARDRLKRYGDAAGDWAAAAELADDPMDQAFYLAHRGSSLARTGDKKTAAPIFAAALQQAEVVLKGKDLPGMVYYDAAAVMSLAAGGLADTTVAKKYASEAVRLLRRAASVGFLSDPAQVKKLRLAFEYSALHEREDFKKLLAELDAKFPPPPELAPPPKAVK